MSALIQVAGLPRSGTAWVAMLLSLNPQCLAFHDLISTEVDWIEVLASARRRWMWVADCGTYQYAPKATRENSIKIALIQDAEESRARANKAFKQDAVPGSYDYIDWVFANWRRSNPSALSIRREDLWKDSTAARLIWEHAFGPDEKFPEDKVRMLLQMQVQRIDPEIAFAANSLSARTANLF